MRVIIWVAEGTWPACVDAARTYVPKSAEIVLVHLAGDDLSEVTHGAFRGLLGRRAASDPGLRVDDLADTGTQALFRAAAVRLERSATTREVHDKHEIVAVTENADLVIMARDSARPGPRSFGPDSRFVVDHVTCPVLVVRA